MSLFSSVSIATAAIAIGTEAPAGIGVAGASKFIVVCQAHYNTAKYIILLILNCVIQVNHTIITVSLFFFSTARLFICIKPVTGN